MYPARLVAHRAKGVAAPRPGQRHPPVSSAWRVGRVAPYSERPHARSPSQTFAGSPGLSSPCRQAPSSVQMCRAHRSQHVSTVSCTQAGPVGGPGRTLFARRAKGRAPPRRAPPQRVATRRLPSRASPTPRQLRATLRVLRGPCTTALCTCSHRAPLPARGWTGKGHGQCHVRIARRGSEPNPRVARRVSTRIQSYLLWCPPKRVRARAPACDSVVQSTYDYACLKSIRLSQSKGRERWPASGDGLSGRIAQPPRNWCTTSRNASCE